MGHKKRRKRHQKTRERLQKQDSLGKLLDGKLTKEDEDCISTYALGNVLRRGASGTDLNTSGIQGGNLDQKRRKKVKDCDEERDFAATLNSRY